MTSVEHRNNHRKCVWTNLKGLPCWVRLGSLGSEVREGRGYTTVVSLARTGGRAGASAREDAMLWAAAATALKAGFTGFTALGRLVPA
jgi:hypothetical protein